jgi:hypothetical protein
MLPYQRCQSEARLDKYFEGLVVTLVDGDLPVPLQALPLVGSENATYTLCLQVEGCHL